MPMGNSGSHKEGVSRTNKGHCGLSPMAVYLGQQGYCLDLGFCGNKQHYQKDTSALLDKTLKYARHITHQLLLLRLDGGNDSIENTDIILEYSQANEDLAPVDFLIK